MRNILLLSAFLLSGLIAGPPPAHATDEVKLVQDGDSWAVQVWDSDDSEYRTAWVCYPGAQPLCDFPNNGVMRIFGSTWEEMMGGFALSHHEHPINDIADLATELAGKNPLISAGAKINNADSSVSASSVAILGINVPTNSSYVSLVAAHNDLATKFNALVDHLESEGIQTP